MGVKVLFGARLSQSKARCVRKFMVEPCDFTFDGSARVGVKVKRGGCAERETVLTKIVI